MHQIYNYATDFVVLRRYYTVYGLNRIDHGFFEDERARRLLIEFRSSKRFSTSIHVSISLFRPMKNRLLPLILLYIRATAIT